MSKKESVDAASMHPIVHTPGPWIVKDDDPHDHVFTEAKPHRRIANVYGGVKGSNDLDLQNQANARLIAEAPEMFQVVQRFAEPGFIGESELKMLIEECRRIVSKVV